MTKTMKSNSAMAGSFVWIPTLKDGRRNDHDCEIVKGFKERSREGGMFEFRRFEPVPEVENRPTPRSRP